MALYYYLDAAGNKIGPVDKSLLTRVGVTRNTLVWCEGMTQWLPAENVPDLMDIFPPSVAGSHSSSSNHVPMPPQSYMWLAILTTLLCCLPTGIVSIVYASKVDSCWNVGDYEGAYKNSRYARNWGIAGALSSVIVALAYIVLIMVAALSPFALINNL